jgi:dihydrofolate reductase
MTDSAAELPFVLVAAVARNGAIGGEGRLLWRLRSDMRRFREITMGKPVVIGRKTWESIGRPLPGRSVIVVSRDPNYRLTDAVVVADLAAARARAEQLAHLSQANEIIVAGGGQIYQQTIISASRLRLTEVDLAPRADVFFPALDPAQWLETAREAHSAGDGDETAFAFVDYERRPPAEEVF